MFPTSSKDINENILLYLNDEDLVNVCILNKEAYQMCKSDSFWFNKIKMQYPYIPLNILKLYKKSR